MFFPLFSLFGVFSFRFVCGASRQFVRLLGQHLCPRCLCHGLFKSQNTHTHTDLNTPTHILTHTHTLPQSFFFIILLHFIFVLKFFMCPAEPKSLSLWPRPNISLPLFIGSVRYIYLYKATFANYCFLAFVVVFRLRKSF